MKFTKIFALIFFAAAQIFAQESSDDFFNDIDFVEFGSSRKKTEYVIEENTGNLNDTAKEEFFRSSLTVTKQLTIFGIKSVCGRKKMDTFLRIRDRKVLLAQEEKLQHK